MLLCGAQEVKMDHVRSHEAKKEHVSNKQQRPQTRHEEQTRHEGQHVHSNGTQLITVV